MKTVKMSLSNLEGKLSRKEMKGIMAGSGGWGGWCGICFGGLGAWLNSPSQPSCAATAQEYCRSGVGYCYSC